MILKKKFLDIYGWVIKLGVIFLVSISTFIGFAIEVQQQKVFDWERELLYWIHDRHVLPDSVFTTVTHIGDVKNVTIATFLVVLFLLYKRQFQNAATVAVLVGSSAVTNIVIKAVFNRERPELWQWLLEETGSSFPSGHSMLSASLIIGLIIVMWRTKYRWLVLCFGTVAIILVGVSRLVIGVHYPSDVLAGWAVVGVLTCAVLIVNKLFFHRSNNSKD